MSIPHVFDLTDQVRTSPHLPTVETVSDLEQVLESGALHNAADLVDSAHECEACRDGDSSILCFVAKDTSIARCARYSAADWRFWATDLDARMGVAPSRSPFSAGASSWEDWLHATGLDYRARLSDDDRPIPEPADLVDWDGRPKIDASGRSRDPLLEYWRAKHMIRRLRHTGARSRTVSALNAQLSQLEPVAVKHAHTALLDPLNAAIAAAINEEE